MLLAETIFLRWMITLVGGNKCCLEAVTSYFKEGFSFLKRCPFFYKGFVLQGGKQALCKYGWHPCTLIWLQPKLSITFCFLERLLFTSFSCGESLQTLWRLSMHFWFPLEFSQEAVHIELPSCRLYWTVVLAGGEKKS